MEVVLALVIFTFMGVLFGAVFPMTVRGAKYGGNYTQGAMIAQHKMDQLRAAGYERLFDDTSGTTLSKLSGLDIVDAAQPAGYPQAVTGGSVYSFTAADGLVNNGVTQGYFPPGSMGTVTICDYTQIHPSSGIPAGTLAYVTVSLTWTGGGVSDGSYSTSAVIANLPPS